MAAQQTDTQSAPSAWRQYTFFDAVPVKDVHDLASSPEIFKKTPEISCVTSTTLGPLVADIHGSIFLLNRDFDTVKSWLAHLDGRVTHMAERKGILVTLGEEDSSRHPFLKVWDLRATDKKTGGPVLLRSTKVQSGNRPHPVSTIALSPTLAYLAIGLGDGTLLLYRHLDQSIFSPSTNLSNLPKPRTVTIQPATPDASSIEPITGLGFRDPSEDNPHVYLFIVTTNRVLSYQVTGRGSNAGKVVVVDDEVGCGLGCVSMDWRGENVVVGRQDGVYVCGVESRGGCFAYEGPKSSIHTHLNYLIIVSPPFTPSAGAASATIRNFVASKPSPISGEDVTKVTVLDLENKFVAYSGTFTDGGVREVFSADGEVYLLSNNGNLTNLHEHPTSAKLSLLYSKSQYLLALNLAKTQGLPEGTVAEIHKKYGDHLYEKGDFDGAMKQYLKTVGWIGGAYVIRKFLDAQRIHNLVTYLQELHTLGVANSDHTTLLLNTYTKLKDVTRLDAFIKSSSSHSGSTTDELPFDLDTAIRVCRQAGYAEHAAYLSKKYERHEEYLQIMIEDSGNFGEALGYLRRLGSEAAESNLARYGRAMLESLPEETTQLLIDVCTTLAPLSFDSITSSSLEDSQPQPQSRREASSSGPSYLSYLALNRTSASAPTIVSDNATIKPGDAGRRDPTLVDESSTATPPPSTQGNDTPSSKPVPRDPIATPDTPSTPSPATPVPTSRPGKPKRPPSPRIYFAHFLEHKELFIRFLEVVGSKRWGQSLDADVKAEGANAENGGVVDADDLEERRDQGAVWNTLLELYLSKATTTTNGGDQEGLEFKEKALKVLKSTNIPYDPTHALILCSTANFTPGLVLLWERMGMYEDVVRFWMDKYKTSTGDPDAPREVIDALNRYGPSHPHLYPLVLRFLTSTPELLSKHQEDVMKMLEVIDQEKILSPMGVVQVLSRNGVASVGLVKSWLVGRIKEARDEVETDQKLIDSYRTETATKLRQVQELSDPEHPRVFHVTQCTACKGQLDLPSVHFMCDHSYHQRCLGDHETECPNCARNYGIIREIRRNNERLADQHDVFLSEVREGGFAAVAAGFGKGVMNMTRVEEVPA